MTARRFSGVSPPGPWRIQVCTNGKESVTIPVMDAFDALADPVRRELLAAVSGGPMRVVDLAAGHVITRPAVSRHLRLLIEAGLVDAEDRGRERHYRLRPQALSEVRRFLDRLERNGLPEPLSPNALDALDTEVRRASRDRRTRTFVSTAGKPTTVPTTTHPASREDSA